MKHLMSIGAVFALAGFVSPSVAHPGCPGCKEVKAKGEGFCCGQGLVFGHELSSKKLYDVLAGSEVETDSMKCPGCKTAAEKDGVCSHCHVGMAAGKMFRSMVSYALAKGTPVDESGMKCDGCKSNMEKNAFCSGCNVGFVNHRKYADKESYEAALAAHNVLMKALETVKKCEGCAVAMVTDGTCDQCKVSFKEGSPVKGE